MRRVPWGKYHRPGDLPTISNIGELATTADTIDVQCETDMPAWITVEYGTSTAFGSEAYDPKTRLRHRTTLHGLVSGTTYYYRVIATNASGSGSPSATRSFIFQQVQAPIISGVNVHSIQTDQAMIEWSSTPATSGYIEYGTTTSYGARNVGQLEPLTYHNMEVPDQPPGQYGQQALTPDTTYYYRINASAGGGGSTHEGSFATLADAPPPPGGGGTYYGCRMMHMSLNNRKIGDFGNSYSYRFRAEYTGTITAVDLYWLSIDLQDVGYAEGDGGTIRISLRPDDGTSAHGPTNTELAYHNVTTKVSSTGSGTRFTFNTGASVTAGTLYHIVFTNAHASPDTNNASIDCSWMTGKPKTSGVTVSRVLPGYENVDFATMVNPAGYGGHSPPLGAWRRVDDYWSEVFSPIVGIDYSEGYHQGQAYIIGSSHDIGGGISVNGTTKARETFTVSGGARTLVSGMVHARRYSGSGDLTWDLQNSGGSTIESGTISASQFTLVPAPTGTQRNAGEGLSRGTWTFATPRTVSNATQYHIVFSCPAGTTYLFWPILRGAAHDIYEAETGFADGQCWEWNGSSWIYNLHAWGGRISGYNLQVCFTTQ